MSKNGADVIWGLVITLARCPRVNEPLESNGSQFNILCNIIDLAQISSNGHPRGRFGRRTAQPFEKFVHVHLRKLSHANMSAPTTSTGTSPSSSLPIISIAPWLPPSFSSSSSSSSQNPTTKNLSEKRAETSRALHQACLTYGFFYLDITSISSLNSSESESSFMLLKNELDELEDLARKFFAIEQVKKDNIGIGKGDGVRGEFSNLFFLLPKFYYDPTYRSTIIQSHLITS